MEAIKKIQISEFDYALPDERIARYPLAQRDASKLLVLKEGKLKQDTFKNIVDWLPKNSKLVLNETKVVQARLQFTNANGAAIELFVLEPAEPGLDFQLAYARHERTKWNCLVGNSKRWKSGSLELVLKDTVLTAERLEKLDGHSVIQFSWTNDKLSFAEILEAAGEIPLPPYLNRKAEPDDKLRYQTVFARHEGSVAAPTASLHLTEPLMQHLKQAGHSFTKLTLHVGAGTFKPVSAAEIGQHDMHAEQIVVNKTSLIALLSGLESTIIPVGTTAMRSLESLFWFGQMIQTEGDHLRDFHLNQWFPYEQHLSLLSAGAALENILHYLEKHQLEQFRASTALMIAPGYKMKIVKGLITNFHQPKSTLLLLVSALIGSQWKEAYQFALDNDFRFLSYGDSCLFLPE